MLIVDQNGDDRLAPVLARFAGQLAIEHVRTDTRGLSRARNVGLARATGELVGFPDDDCEYLPGTLAAVDALFAAERALDGITGHPTADRATSVSVGTGTVTLDRVGVMNRCQEFTIFVRRSSLGTVRFNDLLGVGAGTPWGSDEGPDFLVRLVDAGRRLVYHPRLFVYHPDKHLHVDRATLRRAASYARGRGAFFRLNRYPARVAATAVARAAGGAVVRLVQLRPRRSAYYAAIAAGLCRGLLMSRRERATLAGGPNHG